MRSYSQILLLLLSAMLLINPALAGDNYWPGPYRSGVLVFKVAQSHKLEIPAEGLERYGQPEIDRFMDDVGAYRFEPMFPYCFPPVPGGSDLTRIYTLYFSETLPVVDLCNSMASVPGVEYAEPWIIDHTIDYNDPSYNRQYGLRLVESEAAHEITTGDPDAIVAIVDSGVDHDHEDLIGNRFFNSGEDLNDNGRIDNNERNGEDDDNNGFIDDFIGWDFVSRDADPNDQYGHGTHVAGIASAVTNNRTGIASVGYSCSIMAVRVGEGNTITHGYQGIQYAVRTGAHVVNCSWGGPQRTQWAESIVDYAFDNDVLVVGGAGNDNTDDLFYPAAFEHVVAVGGTDQNDRKAGFSNYGDWIDVSAPGVAIYSTYMGGNGNRYGNMDGTSMSSPFAASVAVLLYSYFPQFTVEEIWELLVDGADDIGRDDLGSGRINILQSLQLGMRPEIEIDDFEITVDDNDNGRLDPDEGAEIAITLYNGPDGQTAEDIIVTLITDDEKIYIENPVIEFPDIEPNDEFTNDEDPFVVNVDDTYPHTTYFLVTVSAGPGDFEVSMEIELVIGHPDILIVDDDDGEDFESYYIDALDDLEKGWVKWDAFEYLAPDPEMLQDYEMVVWFTGNSEPALDELDRWQLESAFGEGANIFLTGQYIGDDADNASILLNYFGARHNEDEVSAITVIGISDRHPIAEDTEMLLLGNAGAGNGRRSPSTMIPALGADSLVVYERSEDEITGLAGVYYYNERDDYRTVYFGFAFEGVSGLGETTSRGEVLDQLYTWFSGDFEDAPFEQKAPVSFNLAPAYPNPFNSQINLQFSLPNRTDYRLWVTDMHGREVALIGSGVGEAGTHSTTWQAEGLPSGVYVASISATGSATLKQKLVLVK